MKQQIARIYGRFSSMPQERGDSKRRQIEGAISYAAKHGFTLLKDKKGQPLVYFDEGVSGKAGANLEKEFGKLLDDANEGETILCEAIDRIGRQNPILICKLLYDTVQKGITVIAWQEGKTINRENIDTLETQFSVFTGAAVGHADNRRKMKRLSEITEQAYVNGKNGIQSGSLVKYLPECFRWNEEKKEIEVDEMMGETIRDIFAWYAAGTGRTSIAQKLNALDRPTIYSKTAQQIGERKTWRETSISKILRNESYAGVLNVRGHKITCIPTVVDRDLFDKCQLLLNRNTQRRGNLTGRINNLFMGVSRCKYCGGTVNVIVTLPGKTHRHNNTYYSYRCMNARLKNCKDAKGVLYPHKLFPARIVETMFFDGVFGGTPDNDLNPSTDTLKTKIAVVEANIQKCTKAIANLFDMAEDGDTEAKARITKRRTEKEAFEQELRVLRGTVVEQQRMPVMLQEVADIIALDKTDTKKHGIAYVEYLEKLYVRLNDKEVRRKIVNLMPSLFDKVVFDCINGTIQPVPKDARSPLPRALIYAKGIDDMVKKMKKEAA